jgi:hypothetical protein
MKNTKISWAHATVNGLPSGKAPPLCACPGVPAAEDNILEIKGNMRRWGRGSVWMEVIS